MKTLILLLLCTSAFGDECATIIKQMAALPANGGIVTVPAGTFTCSETVPVTKNSITIQGQGWSALISNGATTLNFAAGLSGLTVTGQSVTLKNMNIMSLDTGANSDNGIVVEGGEFTLSHVQVGHFGNAGIMLAGNYPTTADSWDFMDVQSVGNYGDGVLLASPCSDNNLGIGRLISTTSNGGWGFDIQCGLGNTFNSPLVQNNILGGFNVQASFNTFNDAYCESGTGSTFVIGSGSPNYVSSTRVNFSAFGQCAMIANPGPTAQGQRIEYSGPDGWLLWNGLWVGDEPSATTNKSWNLGVGWPSPGDVFLYDYSDNLTAWYYDPTAQHLFLGTTTNITQSAAPANPQPGDVWYNSTTDQFCMQKSTTQVCQ